MKITRRHLLKIIQEEVESVCEGEKASKSKGKPYKGSRRGKTESQAQQMAAGIALSARRKYGKKGAIKKLRGAPKSMADMSMKDLVKLATIRRGSEVPDSTKKGHERAALPGHIAESDNKVFNMKITRKQLRQTIREELNRIVEADTDGDGALDADEIRQLASDLEGESQEPLRVWGIPYNSGFAYGGRRVISRDRAWLEFVPKGNGPDTKEDMFRSVTLLEPGDPEVQKVIDNPRNSWYVRKYLKNTPLEKFDVYSVYAHTTG